MTANQINYQKYLEDVRSHRASESISSRQAAAAESQAESAAANAISNRMNAETNAENLILNESAIGAQWYGAQANAAYQTAMAAVSQAQQREAVRHNIVNETQNLLIEGGKLSNQRYATDTQAETQRYSTDVNAKTSRTNVEQQVRGQLINTLINTTGNLGAQFIGTIGKGIASILGG